jgi:Ca2+-binding EF-hand superfamily protein
MATPDTALQKYGEYDEETRRRLLCGDLSEETKLPRELLERFHEMWCGRARPFFSDVAESGLLSRHGLAEVVRNLGVHSDIICRSISRVIAADQPTVDFGGFVRGYASLHARTLREAIPFAFKVFDLDGDGLLCPAEFKQMLSATLELKKLDGAAVKRVLAVPAPDGQSLSGLSSDQFRYFASLSAETILATCGFLLHVNAFYVPPIPLGPEAEEREEEEKAAAARAATARWVTPGAAPLASEAPAAQSVGSAASGEAGGVAELANPFEDENFLSALESLRTSPEERAERQKNKGNAALRANRSLEPNSLSHAVERYTEGLAEQPRDTALMAVLLNNRAAAHTMLKNWGKTLADSTAALEVRRAVFIPGGDETPAGEGALSGGAQAGVGAGSPSVSVLNGITASGAVGRQGEKTRLLHTPTEDRALPLAAQLKAARRGAAAALRLDKLAEAWELCDEGRRLAAVALAAASSGDSAGDTGGEALGGEEAKGGEMAGGGEDMGEAAGGEAKPVVLSAAELAASARGQDGEIESIFRRLAIREGELHEARERAAALVAMQAELKLALHRRKLPVSDFTDEALRLQCVGENSGARVWYDAASDEVHWPVLFLYPEASMSDFIQDMSESEPLMGQLLEMFGAKGESAPPWDHERKYAAGALQPYVCFEGEGGGQVVRPLRADAPLGLQLAQLGRGGYAVPGVPIIHVLVRGSPFEAEFLRRDGRA